MKEFSAGNLESAQAMELALLVDLEACWENLRSSSLRPSGVQASTQSLHNRQRAYEVFRAKLATYNQRYAPAHVSELQLNTPGRLGLWCRAMRDLYARIEHEPQARCPVHLLEKAYRWAERLADSLSKPRLSRSNPQGTIRATIQELDGLCQWCANLASMAPAA
jgi:hypothetical protein